MTAAWVFVPLFLTTGCRVAYVFHAALGQAELLHGSRPVSEVLDQGLFSSEKEDRIRLIQEIRRYGEDVLGLKRTNNYESVYIRGQRPPIFVLSAAPRNRFEAKTWWFPIVGRVPYLGFFDAGKALAAQERLEQEGLDTCLRTAAAYSTLGWFSDPITPNLLAEAPSGLAEIILHELTHATLYIRGQGAFNEGLAMLVGLEGAEGFCRGRFGEDHPETAAASHAILDQRLFGDFMARWVAELESLYARNADPEQDVLVERQRIFEAMITEFRELKPRLKTPRFAHFGRRPLNNACLLGAALYHRHYRCFDDLYHRLNRDIPTFLSHCRSLGEDRGKEPLMERIRRFTEDSHLHIPAPGQPGRKAF